LEKGETKFMLSETSRWPLLCLWLLERGRGNQANLSNFSALQGDSKVPDTFVFNFSLVSTEKMLVLDSRGRVGDFSDTTQKRNCIFLVQRGFQMFFSVRTVFKDGEEWNSMFNSMK
jgi:hypothetical protein